jgi:hypothetical protein
VLAKVLSELWLIAVLTVGLALPSSALAAEDAESLIKHGVALRRQGNDAAALQEFRRAYDLTPSPRAAAQMGLAEQQMQSWVDASRHLAEALREQGDPWIKKNRPVLESSLHTVESHVGRVLIGGEPAGAEVFVNGQNAGTVPLREPATVPPGPVRVEVRSPGYVTSALSIVVPAGDLNRVEVRLERERAVTPGPLTARPGALTRASSSEDGPVPRSTGRRELVQQPMIEPVHEAAEGSESDRPSEPSPSSTAHTARWIALGFTAVFAAGGAAGFLIREQNVKSFNGNRCSVDSRSGTLMSPAGQATNCRAWSQNAETAKTVGIVGAVGAGLLAVTSAVLFFAF